MPGGYRETGSCRWQPLSPRLRSVSCRSPRRLPWSLLPHGPLFYTRFRVNRENRILLFPCQACLLYFPVFRQLTAFLCLSSHYMMLGAKAPTYDTCGLFRYIFRLQDQIFGLRYHIFKLRYRSKHAKISCLLGIAMHEMLELFSHSAASVPFSITRSSSSTICLRSFLPSIICF